MVDEATDNLDYFSFVEDFVKQFISDTNLNRAQDIKEELKL